MGVPDGLEDFFKSGVVDPCLKQELQQRIKYIGDRGELIHVTLTTDPKPTIVIEKLKVSDVVIYDDDPEFILKDEGVNVRKQIFIGSKEYRLGATFCGEKYVCGYDPECNGCLECNGCTERWWFDDECEPKVYTTDGKHLPEFDREFDLEVTGSESPRDCEWSLSL